MKSRTITIHAVRQFSFSENALHSRYAARALTREGWENTSAAFLAMKRECTARGLRPCGFRHFCARIRSLSRDRFLTTQYADLPPGELAPRSASVATLLRELDRLSIIGL